MGEFVLFGVSTQEVARVVGEGLAWPPSSL